MSGRTVGSVRVISPALRRRLKTAAKLGVTGTILYLIFTFVPFAEVVRSIRMARIPYLLLAAVVVIVPLAILARWRRAP